MDLNPLYPYKNGDLIFVKQKESGFLGVVLGIIKTDYLETKFMVLTPQGILPVSRQNIYRNIEEAISSSC